MNSLGSIIRDGKEISVWLRDLDGDNIWIKVTNWRDLCVETKQHNVKADGRRAYKRILEETITSGGGLVNDRYEIVLSNPYRHTDLQKKKNNGILLVGHCVHGLGRFQ